MTDVSDMKMTRFGYRVDLIRERHVRVKDEAKITSRDFGMISLLRGCISSFLQQMSSVSLTSTASPFMDRLCR